MKNNSDFEVFYTNLSDPLFWKTDCKVVFSNKGCWDSLENLMLCNNGYDFVSDNKNPFYHNIEIAHELYHFYQKMQKKLCIILNKIHDEKHDMVYWEILTSWWLINYISSLWIEYNRLKLAIEKFGIINAQVIEKKNRVIVKSTRDYGKEISSNQYFKWQILSYILEEILEKNNLESVQFDFFKKDQIVKNNKTILVRCFRFVKYKYIQIIRILIDKAVSSNGNEKILVTYFPMEVFRKLKIKIFSLGKISFLKNNLKDISKELLSNTEQKLRDQFNNIFVPQNEFEAICLKLIKYSIPLDLVENYKQNLQKLSKKINGGVPQLILSVDLYVADTDTLTLCAHYREKGAKMVLSSHAGCYEIIGDTIKYEAELSDYYLTWGYHLQLIENCLKNKAYNFGMAFRLLEQKKLIKYTNKKLKGGETILYVSTHSKAYSNYLFISTNEDLGLETYFSNQKLFFDYLRNDLITETVYRMRDENPTFKYGIVSKMQEIYPNLRISSNDGSISDALKTCKVCVVDCHTTVVSEALLWGSPIIIILNKNSTRMPKGIQSYYEKLIKVGICYDSSQKAAQFINENYNNIESWWLENERQEVIRDYCNNFVYVPDNSMVYFCKELLNMVREVC